MYSCLIIFTTGCHKRQDPQPASYHITHAGELYTGNAISFTSDAPTGYTFLWQFGDGSTSTDKQPHHIYDSTGKFEVTLVINGNVAFTAKDTVIVGFHSFDQLTGVKNWHHTYTGASPWPPYHPAYPMSDTSFSVTFIDPLTISVGADTLSYLSNLHSDSLMAFSKQSGYYIYQALLVYNYISNTAHYTQKRHISVGAGDEQNDYTTP